MSLVVGDSAKTRTTSNLASLASLVVSTALSSRYSLKPAALFISCWPHGSKARLFSTCSADRRRSAKGCLAMLQMTSKGLGQRRLNQHWVICKSSSVWSETCTQTGQGDLREFLCLVTQTGQGDLQEFLCLVRNLHTDRTG